MNIKFIKDEDGENWDIGDAIRIEASLTQTDPFDDTESKVNIANFTITITGYNDNEVVSQQALTNHDTGQYFYKWDTTGLDAGDYEVKVEASENGVKETETAWIKLKA